VPKPEPLNNKSSDDDLEGFEIKEIIVDKDGRVSFLYDDDLAELAACLVSSLTVKRASHIEPTSDGKWRVDVSPLLTHLNESVASGGPETTNVVTETSRWDEASEFEKTWVRKKLRGE
jgi:hypothetical protein